MVERGDISLLLKQLRQLKRCDSISCPCTVNTNLWAVSVATGGRSRWATSVQEGGVVLRA